LHFPDAFNNDLIVQTLRDILAGKKCEIPVYDYKTNSRYELYVLYNVLHVFNGNTLVGSHECKKLDKQSSRSYNSDYAIMYRH